MEALDSLINRCNELWRTVSSEVKKRKRNEEWEIVETNGEKRSPDYTLEERRNYRKRIKYFERLIVREESENREITKRIGLAMIHARNVHRPKSIDVRYF